MAGGEHENRTHGFAQLLNQPSPYSLSHQPLRKPTPSLSAASTHCPPVPTLCPHRASARSPDSTRSATPSLTLCLPTFPPLPSHHTFAAPPTSTAQLFYTTCTAPHLALTATPSSRRDTRRRLSSSRHHLHRCCRVRHLLDHHNRCRRYNLLLHRHLCCRLSRHNSRTTGGSCRCRPCRRLCLIRRCRRYRFGARTVALGLAVASADPLHQGRQGKRQAVAALAFWRLHCLEGRAAPACSLPSPRPPMPLTAEAAKTRSVGERRGWSDGQPTANGRRPSTEDGRPLPHPDH